MSIAYNLALAEMAIAYVGKHITHGASNKPIDIIHSQMHHGGVLTVDTVETQRDNLVGVTHGLSEAASNQHLATAAMASGIGNCAEQATIAFQYLQPLAGNQIICVVGLGTDHVCVMIAPPATYALLSAHDEPLANPPAWPADAVVCDPWYHEWFSVHRDWSRKIRSILRSTHPADAVNANVRIDVIDRFN